MYKDELLGGKCCGADDFDSSVSFIEGANGKPLPEAAQWYVALGWPVFPVDIDKRPLTKHGYRDATTVRERLRVMFENPRAEGIAVATGEASGLLVIDRDRKHGVDGIANCEELERALGSLPDTLKQKTGSGGDQLFFQFPKGTEIRCSAGVLTEGVDIRANGGYAVVSPSCNRAGDYVWLNDASPALLPEDWAERLARRSKPVESRCPALAATKSTPYGRAALSKECARIAASAEGARNDTLNSGAYAIGRLVAGGEIVELEAVAELEKAAAACGLDCLEGEKTIRSGMGAGMKSPRRAHDDFFDSCAGESSDSDMSCVATGGETSVSPTDSDDGSGYVGSSGVRLPAGYYINARGLCYADQDDPDKPATDIWLGSAIEFIAMTRDCDSNSWGKLIAWHDPDGNRHTWAMPNSLLLDARHWQAELAKGGWIGATSAKAKALLSELFTKVVVKARALCVDRTGWHGSAYVLPDVVLGKYDQLLVLQASLATNPFTRKGSLEEWNTAIGVWAQGNSLLMFAISAALSGPLLGLVNVDSGGFHIWGHSSSGKTTVLQAAWSVWGAMSGVRTWRSTANALEATGALHNDSMLGLDEIGQAPGRVVGEAAYMLANGQGKSRAYRDGSAQPLRSWRCVIISNGEMTLVDKMREDGQQSKAGQEVRIIDLAADAGKGFGAWQELHGFETPSQFSDAIKAACTSNYGLLGRAFVEELSKRMSELTISEDVQTTATGWTPAGSSGQVCRVIKRFALAGIAGELVTSYGLVPWGRGEALAAARDMCDAWLTARGTSGDREDLKAVEMVQSFIVRFGASRFQQIDSEHGDHVHDRAGFRRMFRGKPQYLFTKEQLERVVSGQAVVSVAQALDRAGLLHKNESKGLQVSVTIPGISRKKVYAVNLLDEDIAA
jgi:uncharacterized protein (DUF927 family)